MLLILRVAWVLLLLFATSASAAERQTVPGTSWSIASPDGFELQTNPIAGFVHPSGAMLLVIDSPLKPLDISRMAKPGTISGQGKNAMRVDEVRQTTIGGRRAILIRGYATMRDLDMVSAYIEGETTMGTVIASVPKGAAVAIAKLEVAVLSAVETPKPVEERLAALPYRLDDLAGMQVDTIITGLATTITDRPKVETGDSADQPFATIFTITADVPQTVSPEEHAQHVRGRIAAQDRILAQPPGSAILTSAMIDTVRGPVLEMTYSYKDRKTGQPISGVAWLRADGNSLVFVVGRYPEGQPYYDRLARVRDGIFVK